MFNDLLGDPKKQKRLVTKDILKVYRKELDKLDQFLDDECRGTMEQLTAETTVDYAIKIIQRALEYEEEVCEKCSHKSK